MGRLCAEDVPVILQADIVAHFGRDRRISHRRVCKAWKALLGPWPRTVVIDELHQQEKSVYNWSKSREKIMKDAHRNCQVLIIDLSRPYSAPSHADFDKDFLAMKTFSNANSATRKAIVKSKTLQHVILYGGRMCLQLFANWHPLMDIPKRKELLKISLINCSLTYKASMYAFQRTPPRYPLFSRNIGETLIPNWNAYCPVKEKDVRSEFLRIFKRLLFPYSDEQLDWLDTCLVKLESERNTHVDREPYSAQYWGEYLKSCWKVKLYIRDWIRKSHDEPVDFVRSAENIEMVVVATSYLARLISTDKLDLRLPSPPDDVPVCPVHDCVICPCPADPSDLYDGFKRCRQNI